MNEKTRVIDKRIDDLEFSTRVMNALNVMKVVRLGDLARMTEAELLRSPNLGRKSLFEIRELLAEFGLTLGMVFDAPPEIRNQRPPPSKKSIADYIHQATARRVAFLEDLSRVGYSPADIHLGRLYLEGIGVHRDYRKARLYFLRAARRGNHLGYSNLALIYRIGYGTRRSEGKANRWMKASVACLSRQHCYA